MDCQFGMIKQNRNRPMLRYLQHRINLYLYIVIVGVGIQHTSAQQCVIQLGDGGVPCTGNNKIRLITRTEDAKQCCSERHGRCFYTDEINGRRNCSVCEELLTEHEWLPFSPSLDCEDVPTRRIWFNLSVPNRRIQCLGRSFEQMLHCGRNDTDRQHMDGVKGSGGQTSDAVFCFKNRFPPGNWLNEYGCPASSLDWELARNIEDCCAKRGRAGYARRIKEWYIREARMYKCLPCSDIPPEDATWSDWTVCELGSKCTRKRFMQIPYIRNTPKQWCLETIIMEEPTEETENGCTVMLALAILGLSTCFVLVGVQCFFCIRKHLKLRSRSSSTSTAIVSSVDDRQTEDGYLIPISSYEGSENIYDELYDLQSNQTLNVATADMPCYANVATAYMVNSITSVTGHHTSA